MNKLIAYAYNSHIEVPNYVRGMLPMLERSLQVYNKFHKKLDLALDVVDDTLYLPRSMQPYLLQDLDITNRDNPIEYISFFANIKRLPKDNFQENSISFLTGKFGFHRSAISSQVILTAPPGSGKTFCAICALVEYGMRTIVICHRKKILMQWAEEIIISTDIKKKDILFLDSKNITKMMNGYKIPNNIKVVLSSQQTFTTFAKNYTWSRLNELMTNLKVGLKIVDEAHRHFRNTFLIDAHSNIKKSIYLTATFNRSDYNENKVFQNAYSLAPKYGLGRIEEIRRHIIYIEIRYNSKPDVNTITSMYNALGFFDKNKYTEYQLNHKYIDDSIEVLMKNIFMKHEGRYLILSSTKESTRHYKELMDDIFPNKLSCVYNSDISEEYKEYAMDNADIICSTTSSLGEGTNMKKLRFLFMTEAFSSKVNSYQNPSRLREYASDKNCFYIEFIDEGFKQVVDWQKRRKKEFDRYFLENRIVRYEDLIKK